MMKTRAACLALTCLLLQFLPANAKGISEAEYVNVAQKPRQLSATFNQNMTARKYILGPNDVISISIFGVPEFEQKGIRVQPDGRIVITPVGPVNVAGLTIDELYRVLNNKYSEYLQNPQLSINLDESRPFIVYITGAVLNPGSYEMNTNTTRYDNIPREKPETSIERKTPLLSNVLVAAGGLSHDADIEHIQVVNTMDNSKYELNLLELLDKGDSSQDIYLMTGDTVNIPRLPTPLAVDIEKYKKFASATFSPRQVPVKIYGYVNNPGLIKLDPARSLNINSAITAAGGYLNDAAYAPKSVYISRADVSGKLVTNVVNPQNSDVALLPNDVIYVPEKIRPMTGRAFDYLARIISPMSGVASTYNNWALMFDPGRFYFIGR